MNIYLNPKESEWDQILQRPRFDTSSLYDSVSKIISDVKSNGDEAIRRHTETFDKVKLDTLLVPAEEIEGSSARVSEELKAGIKEAHRNIKRFHSKQLCPDSFEETTPGVKCWQKTIPIQSVGLYIPGGSAPLLSTVLMLGVPATIAGCKEIVLCTPPSADGSVSAAILYIAKLLGIEKVFRIGGVQAISAMAYGTESVPKVNKIFGPGNQYVVAAKQICSRDSVAIDMPAGPSELAVMADESCVPAFVASDLLSQAEHGPDSQVILISDSMKVIEEVKEEINLQLVKLPRKEIAAKSLESCKLIQVKDKQEMVRMVNTYAPEHLVIACENYSELAAMIYNAGSVFLGNYSPESAGDYASGTNHTLPTNGWAHAYGGLNMDAFVKKITFQEISKYGLFNISASVIAMAEAEELEAHRNAVSIRMKAE